MKYICLGYHDETKWDELSPVDRDRMIDECLAYDDELTRNGHFAGGEALQFSRNAMTLRWQGGQVSFTDGPYAETKEQIGGILILEATDLNHAIQLMSKHPAIRLGTTFEIRPSACIDEIVSASRERRASTPA